MQTDEQKQKQMNRTETRRDRSEWTDRRSNRQQGTKCLDGASFEEVEHGFLLVEGEGAKYRDGAIRTVERGRRLFRGRRKRVSSLLLTLP